MTLTRSTQPTGNTTTNLPTHWRVNTMQRWIAPVFLALAVALTGCGGGGSSSSADPVPSGPTGSALQTTRLVPNQAVESRFTDGQARRSSVDPDSGDDSYYAAYEITLTAPGTLTVLMQSPTLDSYLQLFDETFLDDPSDDTAFIAESDDVGSTLHALVSEELPAGTYVVVAGTAFANSADTGTYALMSVVTE